MRLNKLFIASLFLAVFAISCEKDDDGGGTEVIPPRDRGEQEIADQEALVEYLNTHFYNYEDFQNPPSDFDYRVRLDTLDAENADKTPLIESDLLEKKVITRNEVDYTINIIKVMEGAGEKAKFSDSTFVSYRGELLNRESFDASTTPVWFDLVNTIPGFGQSLNEFAGASGFEVNADNTITWSNDFGIGSVFIPSGLGYFSTARTGIPAYSPLVFNIQVFAANEADHDHDGIPSYMEDLDGDENVLNDDTDGDLIANFSDPDDDGDFVATKEEIVIKEDGTLEFPDTDGDGTPDYLDKDTY